MRRGASLSILASWPVRLFETFTEKGGTTYRDSTDSYPHISRSVNLIEKCTAKEASNHLILQPLLGILSKVNNTLKFVIVLPAFMLTSTGVWHIV